MVEATGELKGPLTWGLEPVKSKVMSDPRMVMVTLMSLRTSISMPSLSR